ncbi:LLM class oxidoreductase [Actinomadura montaniterrae]|uniref:LLM class flavin-dependent oxidoreductase n=1 Tax=Actinomadura montaniterrae TaxID=1803903 RepID=A0A6L3W037_9ACTN|nr:LLM class flavin-dependent oxidoreductase [Actinomadura montaniterrae]KAB2388227.1 LLM class flavin-dependent oxidoreductase [Actinomadura montaniterrae]
MPRHHGSRPRLALALTGGQALAVLDEDALTALLDRAPLAFTVVGADRLAPVGAGAGRTADPSAAATVLAARTTAAAFLFASSPVRDHPYNLARRVASLGHLSHGRTGLVVGVADPYVAALAARTHGEGPELTRRAGTAEAHDLALATRELEQTWPYDAIVADREQRIFARGDRIRRADHQGVYSVAGPLTLPAPRTGASVVAWWANRADELEAAADVADLVIVPHGLASGARSVLDAASGRHFADPGHRPLLFAVVDVPPGTAAADARASTAAAAGADGIVLRPTGPDPREAIELAGRLHAGGDLAAGPLRARLGLPEAADLLPDGPGVFPAPVPQR